MLKKIIYYNTQWTPVSTDIQGGQFLSALTEISNKTKIKWSKHLKGVK